MMIYGTEQLEPTRSARLGRDESVLGKLTAGDVSAAAMALWEHVRQTDMSDRVYDPITPHHTQG